MTPPAGKRSSTASSPAAKRAPFELLAFTAAPVAGALVVVELEGRFASAQGGRFARRPVLVVEADEDRPRLELAPVRATLADGGRWRSAYAIPAEAFPGARFALGLRGTLLELPAPDEPDDADRLTALAREANSLRRALEAAEAEAAAASAARDEALAESTDRITALEAELAEAHATAAEQATTAREEAEQRIHAEQERAEQLATASAADADARVQVAEERARAAEAGADDRARVAEETALAAASGIEVLRAELAEERERSRLAITELEAAQRRADALRNAAAAEAAADEDEEDDATQPLVAGAIAFDDDATRPLDVADLDDDATRPLDLAADADLADAAPSAPPVTLSSRRGRTVRPQSSPASAHADTPRGPGPWIAVGALALFAFALLGLLVGFLP